MNSLIISKQTHLPNAYIFQSELPIYTVPCESIEGEESIGNRDISCFSSNVPSGLMADSIPFHDPTKIVPSALIVADEVTVSPVL